MNRKRFIFLFLIIFVFAVQLLFSGALILGNKIQTKDQEKNHRLFTLVGVILSDNPSSSMAVLKYANTDKVMIKKIGDDIFGMKLVHMFQNRIVLKRGETTFQIFIGSNRLKELSGKTEKSSREIITSEGRNTLSKGNANNFYKILEFERQVFERKAGAEMPGLINKVKMQQNLVNGKMRGVRIAELPANSFISELEICENDIVREINGIQINDFRTLFSLYNKLRDQNRFEVVIERNGSLIRMLYILK